MKQSTVILIAAIIIAGTAGFFIGRNTVGATKNSEKPVAENTTKSDEQSSDAMTTLVRDTLPDTIAVLPAAGNEDMEASQPNESGVAETQPATTSQQPTTPRPNTGVEGTVLPKVNTGISLDKMSEVLESISDSLEKAQLAYVSSLGQDCSGIYHKIKDILQTRLPALKEGSQYMYPQYNVDRSSRQIADWYYQNGNLLIVEDPIASKNSIRPGAVMFFGQAGKLFSDITIEMLTDRDNNYTKDGAIQHIAVVTSIRTDENGDLIDYTMMHARYPGGPAASRSGSKEVQSTSARSRDKVAPYPFGHWTQQWVAVSNIVTLK